MNNAELAEKTHLRPWYIECLETRNYQKLFKEGHEYHNILQNLKTICRTLHAEDTLVERARELLTAELKADGLDFTDSIPSRTGHIVTDSSEIKHAFNHSVMDYLPQVILIALIVSLLLIIIFAKVLPFINGRQAGFQEVPIGPLVKPVQPRPVQLPIP